MAKIVKTDFTTQTLLHYLLEKYHDEQKFEFACAMHRLTKWELVGLEHDNVLKKAAVKHPDGGYFDARGKITEDDFKGDGGTIITFKLEAELNLKAGRFVVMNDIMNAGKLIQTTWPDLPWHEDSYIVHVTKFMTALEHLCRKHEFWLKDTFNQITTNGSGYEIYITGNGEYRFRLKE